MKPGDYIELSDIKGPGHHQRIRDAVRAMGYRVNGCYGRYDEIENNTYNCLVLWNDGDLIFSTPNYGTGNRINPDDLLGESKQELPPVGEWQQPKRISVPEPMGAFTDHSRYLRKGKSGYGLVLVYETEKELEDALSKLKEETNDEN